MNGKGKVTSIERRESYHDMAKENVKKLGYETEFDFRLGDAQDVLDAMMNHTILFLWMLLKDTIRSF
jgi:predicted O-methyltransferase YrrM